jgi:hypothetical protein
VLPQRNSIGIEVLYSLNLLSQVSIEVSKDTLKVFVYYVCITHLGVEFLTKCDNELNHKLAGDAEPKTT